MAFINFLKPKNQLEEGGRTAAPVQQDQASRKKAVPTVINIFRSAVYGQTIWSVPAGITSA